jgi:hypothetical protein
LRDDKHGLSIDLATLLNNTQLWAWIGKRFHVHEKILSLALLAALLVLQSVPRAQAQTYCDQAQFVSDLTAPDGSPSRQVRHLQKPGG